MGPIFAILAAAIIITLVLFIEPFVGMEDNGDFSRVAYGEGLYDLPENKDILQNGYFIKEYGIMQYYNEYSSTVITSQFILIQPAIWLDKLFAGNDEIFDIRFLGMLQAIYFLAVLYFLVEYLSHKLTLVSSLLIAAACVLVFVDTGYIAYFNSFFAEPLAYTSLMACVTCALLYSDNRYNKYVLLAGFVLNGLILTFSKQQFAPIGVLLGILCLFFYIKAKKGKLFKALIAVASGTLMAAGITTYLLISVQFTNINMFHAMTRGVLMTADNPAETLQTFDIDSQYELLNREIYFDRYPLIDAEDEMLIEGFYSKYNVLTIVKHYVSNPTAFTQMLKLAAQNAYRIRPALGNYEYNSGYSPNTLSQSFSVYSAIKEIYTPKTIGFMIIWTIIVMALLYKKRFKQIIILGVILIGYSQILVSVFGAGDADLAKHVFLYNVAFDMVNLVMIAHIIAYFDGKYSEKRFKANGGQSDIENVVYKNT